jgi:uncharacterized protein (DUF302 family)
MFRHALTVFLASLFLAPLPLLASSGMITVNSNYSVPETADRLEVALAGKGMKIFNRIDHAAGAASVGQELRPTILVIFGNPKVGTALMLCNQNAGIDLPLKALIWQDENGQVNMSYNDPDWLGDRHGMADICKEPLKKISGALKGFSAAATAP